MLSVIIPTFNEMQNHYLQKSLPILTQTNAQIIVVDSFSTDGTTDFVKQYPVTLLQHDTTSRAGRLNAGIQAATGEMILLHHPRSVLPLNGIQHLIDHANELQWGAFTHHFDVDHRLLAFTSWYSNHVRGDVNHIYYLDHCLFARKELLLKVGLIPEVDIFEDTEICKKLRKLTPPIRLPYSSTTSAIRFIKNGIWRQAILNQKMKWMYYFKTDHKKMNKNYDNLNLNSTYERDTKS
jgi:glycosyltransferase involved in cell wall biosynthesis